MKEFLLHFSVERLIVFLFLQLVIDGDFMYFLADAAAIAVINTTVVLIAIS